MLTGEKLGRYKIGRMLGSGGMGEVYIAHDEQLDRDVALKVLLPEFCCQEERVNRFKFEAKAVSALNHPSIITIHEIAEIDDKLFIATEYVDGKTLRDRIEKKDLDVYEAVKIAEQVADALAIAHEANIVHRDIKPENIMIRHDGYAKILDFGLAKPIYENVSGGGETTVQMVKTQPGMVMGSVRYMSPEQARGNETDGRTDIWSLGVVLYEMLTGENPFDGDTISDSLAAVIHKEPEKLPEVPNELGWIIDKALKKDPEERYQTIKDFALDLADLRHDFEHHSIEHIKSNHSSNTRALPRQDTNENKTLIHQTISAENQNRLSFKNSAKSDEISFVNKLNRGYLSVAAILLIAVLGFGGWFLLPQIFGSSGRNFQSIQVSRLTDNGDAHIATVSPDGKLVAFVDTQDGKSKLVVRQVATGGTVEIVPATEKGFIQPTFSNDGEFIYYTQVEKGVGTLFRVATLGGQNKKIVFDIDSRVAISPDGKQLAFIRHNPTDGGDTIFLVDNEGKVLKPFIMTKDVGFNKFHDVFWSNDGEKLFAGGYENAQDPNHKVKFIAVDYEDKKTTGAEELQPLNEAGWVAAYNFELLKDGSGVVYIGKEKTDDSMQIWHLSFASGEIRQITTDTSDYDSVSVSADGNTIVATKVDRISNLLSYTPATKESKQIIGESRNFIGYRRISQMADGKILYSKRTGEEINIFSIDEDGSNEKQLTSDSKFNLNPQASASGKFIVFSSNRNGNYGIWRMNSDGSNPKQLTDPKNARDSDIQIINDDRTVIFARQTNDGGRSKLMKVSIDGGEANDLAVKKDQSIVAVKVSPDEKKIAYLSFFYDPKTSEFESTISIVELNGNEIGEEIKKFPFNLDHHFDWSADGKSLTYIKREGNDNLWNMSVESDNETQLTSFNSDDLMAFLWGNKGNKVFIVRGIVNSDLVLIKDNTDLS